MKIPQVKTGNRRAAQSQARIDLTRRKRISLLEEKDNRKNNANLFKTCLYFADLASRW